MSFPRHEEIYRPMPTATGWGALFVATPALIGTMSFQLAIPWRVALPQSPPPLHQPGRIVQQKHSEHNRKAANGESSLNRVSHSRGQPQLLTSFGMTK